MEVLNCISPESGQGDGSPLQQVQRAGSSPVDRSSQHAQHSRAASHRWRSELSSGSGTALAEEDRPHSRVGGLDVDGRQQAAVGVCRDNKAACVSDFEQPRPRQVSRRGRGRAIQGAPYYRTPAMPVTLDSGRFGFVKLPSPRYADLTCAVSHTVSSKTL